MGQETLQNKITTKFGSILQQASAFLRLSQFSISSTIAVNISLAGYFSRENRKYLISTELQKVLAINT